MALPQAQEIEGIGTLICLGGTDNNYKFHLRLIPELHTELERTFPRNMTLNVVIYGASGFVEAYAGDSVKEWDISEKAVKLPARLIDVIKQAGHVLGIELSLKILRGALPELYVYNTHLISDDLETIVDKLVVALTPPV